MDFKPHKKEEHPISAFFIGVLFMVVAIVGQSIVQIVVTMIVGASRLVPTGIIGYVLYSVYLGGLAGILQEGNKYVAVDMRDKRLTLPIGLGFSAVDIVFLLLMETEITGVHNGIPIVLISLNIVASLLFHPGTAAFLKFGLLSGRQKPILALCILLHLAIDGGLVFTDFMVLANPASYLTDVAVYWIAAMIIAAVVFVLGIVKLRSVEETKPPVEVVVY